MILLNWKTVYVYQLVLKGDLYSYRQTDWIAYPFVQNFSTVING
ncbi:hypothetical protein B14911_09957 [Bacillus sp. NRRL B-14911]|nr:hypothetical protein B14911_09957 [Bacillus sp. NRRL B-14911]